MAKNPFLLRSLPRVALTAAQCASLSLVLAGFAARTGAQTPAVPNAPTVPDAAALPPAAILQAPLAPAAGQEMVEERPSSQHVWINGHWRWQDGNYVWVASHWELPPRANLTWVEPRWEQKNNGYVLAKGYWQEAGQAVAVAPAPMVSMTPPPPPPPTAPGAQEVVIMQAPPPPVQEVIVEQPSPRHVWISGFWTWREGRHVWIGGHWELPPHEHAMWVDSHWEHRGNGYVFVQGFWRDAAPAPGLSVGLSIGGGHEALVIREGPPPPRREYINERERPSPRHIWISGYWRHDGHGYVWMAGHWELPPHGHVAWVEPRWESRGGTYVFVEGHWR